MKTPITLIAVLLVVTGCASNKKTIVDVSNIAGSNEAVSIHIHRESAFAGSGTNHQFVDVGSGGIHNLDVIWGKRTGDFRRAILYLGMSPPTDNNKAKVLFGSSEFVCGVYVDVSQNIVKVGCPNDYGSYLLFQHEDPDYFGNFIGTLIGSDKPWDMGGVTVTQYEYSKGTYLGKLGSGDSFEYHRPAGSLKLLRAACIFGCDPGDKAEIWKNVDFWGRSIGPDHLEVDLEPGGTYYISGGTEALNFSDTQIE